MAKEPTLYISPKSFGHTGLLSPENRLKFFKSVGVSEDKVVSMHLMHTNNVKAVGTSDGGKLFEDTDGLFTDSKEIYLALPVADCIPLMLFDPAKECIGLIHAGWRGLDNGVIKNGIELMKSEYGCDLSDIKIDLGGCICQNHFEVKEDVVVKFADYVSAIKMEGERYFIDLRKVAVIQLIKAGVLLKNIKIDARCTYENEDLFSYRLGDTGRNLYLLTLGF